MHKMDTTWPGFISLLVSRLLCRSAADERHRTEKDSHVGVTAGNAHLAYASLAHTGGFIDTWEDSSYPVIEVISEGSDERLDDVGGDMGMSSKTGGQVVVLYVFSPPVLARCAAPDMKGDNRDSCVCRYACTF